MTFRGFWKPLACAALLSGVALGGFLAHGLIVAQRPGGNPMAESRFVVNHVRVTTDKPFEEFAQALPLPESGNTVRVEGGISTHEGQPLHKRLGDQ